MGDEGHDGGVVPLEYEELEPIVQGELGQPRLKVGEVLGLSEARDKKSKGQRESD
jgi:hypothetical protein